MASQTPADPPNPASSPEQLSKRSKPHYPTHAVATTSSQSSSPPAYLPQDVPQKALAPNFKAPLGSNNQKVTASGTQRRHVSSVDTEDVFLELPRPRRGPTHPLALLSRGIDTSGSFFGSFSEDSGDISHFSDEYDLSHEDPRIVQDVQRALKLKARREARLRSVSQMPSESSSPIRSPRHVSLSPQLFRSPSSPGKTSISSDLDFGPSIGTFLLHPVPASLDNGATLDWSGFYHGSESLWKIASQKRKARNALPPSTLLVNHQETAHADKLARLRIVISPDTLRKAKMTREQLDRRYRIIHGSILDGGPLNIAEVARWRAKQGALVRASLEKAEPFVWLRHLDKRQSKSPDRSRWHLTSLIVEEFIQARGHSDAKVSEEFTTLPFGRPSSPSPLSPQSQSNIDGSFGHLRPSLTRTIPAGGDNIPQIFLEAEGDSLPGTGSQPSGESSFNSLPVTPSNPVHSKLGLPDKVSSSRRMKVDSRNDGSSFSDHSAVVRVLSSPEPDIKVVVSSDLSDHERSSMTGITPAVKALTQMTASETTSFHSRAAKRPARPVVDRVLSRQRVVHASLPSVQPVSTLGETRNQRDADEEKAYRQKARMLEDIANHNHRIRQLLNRISNAVREYDTTQGNAMSALGVTHSGLPRELLDAFGQDPAAVTGATRKFKGWRAVDDICHRLTRQREVFRYFLARPDNNISLRESPLDNPITTLVNSLDALENHRQKIARRALHVMETLISVQRTHAVVKEEYKDTVSHTSIAYPELSHIVALEESYKDQYQQFWEFGMDTLTFILDTVTPFWRTYGTTIGNDMQDFLIIPLYRNEFTGEAKRYPITTIPKRSLRHWLCLFLFFDLSILILVLQARAALSSSIHYKLPMIPYDGIRFTALPFFWISIFLQWWAVFVEFFVVLTQIGILTWWIGWSVGICA